MHFGNSDVVVAWFGTVLLYLDQDSEPLNLDYEFKILSAKTHGKESGS